MNTYLSRYQEMSPADFAAFGMQQLAYVKSAEVDGRPAYAIHAADGTPLSTVADREIAFAVVRQNDLEPVSAH